MIKEQNTHSIPDPYLMGLRTINVITVADAEPFAAAATTAKTPSNMVKIAHIL
jgi:hypothetical protein